MVTTIFQTRELQVSRVDGINYVRVSDGVNSHNACLLQMEIRKVYSSLPEYQALC